MKTRNLILLISTLFFIATGCKEGGGGGGSLGAAPVTGTPDNGSSPNITNPESPSTTPAADITKARPWPQVNGPVSETVGLDNGDILLIGDFTQIGSVPTHGIAKISATGEIDSEFINNIHSFQGLVHGVNELDDGSMILYGDRIEINNRLYGSIAILTDDGNVNSEKSSSLSALFNGPVHDVFIDSDGLIRAVGNFQSPTRHGAPGFALATPNGVGQTLLDETVTNSNNQLAESQNETPKNELEEDIELKEEPPIEVANSDLEPNRNPSHSEDGDNRSEQEITDVNESQEGRSDEALADISNKDDEIEIDKYLESRNSNQSISCNLDSSVVRAKIHNYEISQKKWINEKYHYLSLNWHKKSAQAIYTTNNQRLSKKDFKTGWKKYNDIYKSRRSALKVLLANKKSEFKSHKRTLKTLIKDHSDCFNDNKGRWDATKQSLNNFRTKALGHLQNLKDKYHQFVASN